jgi:hypothetical protein
MTKQDWNSRKLELGSVSFTPICTKDKTRISRKLGLLLLAPIEQASLTLENWDLQIQSTKLSLTSAVLKQIKDTY